MDRLYWIIDKVPELPYFILALMYSLYTPRETAIHVFSTAFVLLATALTGGSILKVMFKTVRPKPLYDIAILKYDFPSLHSMVSIGAIAYVYFIEPKITLILIPIGFLYLYSRIKLGAHTVLGVLSGAAIGFFLGLISGMFLLEIHLHPTIERCFTLLFFIIPVIATILRIKIVPQEC